MLANAHTPGIGSSHGLHNANLLLQCRNGHAWDHLWSDEDPRSDLMYAQCPECGELSIAYLGEAEPDEIERLAAQLLDVAQHGKTTAAKVARLAGLNVSSLALALQNVTQRSQSDQYDLALFVRTLILTAASLDAPKVVAA